MSEQIPVAIDAKQRDSWIWHNVLTGTDYFTIISSDKSDLIKQIDDLLIGGWELQGEVTEYLSENDIMFSQSLVKRQKQV